MRKLLLLALLAGLTGCQAFGDMFTGRKREPVPVAVPAGPGCPDPLLSSDIEEQQRYGRSRYAYPDPDKNIAPPMLQDRPSPSGR